MKKTYLCLLLSGILSMLFLTGCSSGKVPQNVSDSQENETVKNDSDGMTDEEEVMRRKIADEFQVSLQEICFFIFDDFDFDGSCEAFALVGKQIEDEFDKAQFSGSVVYVDEDDCIKLLENVCVFNFDKVSFSNQKYLYFHSPQSFSSVRTYVWTVLDGKPEKSYLTGSGYIIFPEDGERDFYVIFDSYDLFDGEFGMSGHTWKDYYFYYDESIKDFVEYGGTPVDRNLLNEITGCDIVGKMEEKGYVIKNSYYRPNGILNINYEKKQGTETQYNQVNYDCNAHVFLSPNEIYSPENEDWENSGYGGIYAETLFPEHAVYGEYPALE